MGEIINQPNTPLVADLAVAELETQASPVPKDNAVEIPAEIKTNNDVHITLSDRHYRIKNFDKKSNDGQLKINLMVNKGEAMHMDKLDMYSAKQRQVFINQASVECGVTPDIIKTDLGKLLLKLESLQQSYTSTPEKNTKTLSNDERESALFLLKEKNLLKRILKDFNAAGVVGEETNKLVGYLACVSRLLERPLAVMVQSSSAAGKSSLMDAILNLMPENERSQYSAMTGQSLFYMGESDLKHKILAITEEEGAHNASYALKLLQSEGEVTIASTAKDETSGDLVTKEYRVEGPVMLFMTTTAIDIDEELMNRCLVLSVNESREQTKAIHKAQRKSRTLEGLQNKLKKQQITKLHRDAQQLLKPLAIINPYADQLTFLDDKTRTRRDHEKYLTLIDSIALLHQHQRKIKNIEHDGKVMEYIEVTLGDIEAANQLAHDVLGRTLDELPPQTRKLLTQIKTYVKNICKKQKIKQNDYRFSRKALRGYTGASDTQLRLHLSRLVEMEYLLVHQGGRGQSFVYELLYDDEGKNGDAFLMGLIDVGQLKQHHNSIMMESSRGETAKVAGATRPQNGVKTGGKRSSKNTNKASGDKVSSNKTKTDIKNAPLSKNNNTSYRSDNPSLAACVEC